jgi:uncharacterized protein YeaC (DUF1315 family)
MPASKTFIISQNMARLREKMYPLVSEILKTKEEFPSWCATLGKFLKQDFALEMEDGIFQVFDNKINGVLSEYRQKRDFAGALEAVVICETCLPIDKLVPNPKETLKDRFLKIKKQLDQEDYKNLTPYIQDAKSDKRQRWPILQKHSDDFSSVCEHKVEIRQIFAGWQKALEDEEYQKLSQWVEAGNWKDYDALQNKIKDLNGRLQKFFPVLSQQMEIKLDRLCIDVQKRIIESEFEETKKIAESLVKDRQFAEALKKVAEFIRNWRFKLDRFPQAEEWIRKAEVMAKQIRLEWKIFDYSQVYHRFTRLEKVDDLEKCKELCRVFLDNHGDDTSIQKCLAFLKQISQERTYKVKLLDGKHLTNTTAKANLSVHIWKNCSWEGIAGPDAEKDNKIWDNQKQEQDSNEPEWNQEFYIYWKAFDRINVGVWDTNWGNQWIYKDFSNSYVSICERLDGDQGNTTVKIRFRLLTPLYIPTLPSVEDKEKQWK